MSFAKTSALVLLIPLLPADLFCQILPFQAYTTKDGLISNFVTAVIQDSRGYLWVGTNEGLSVYDGAGFTNYTTVDGLSNNFITTLIESKQHPGTIWMGTIQRGLTRYADGRFTQIRVGSTPKTNNVTSIVEDSNGTLLVGTSAGVFRVEGDTATPFLTKGKFANDASVNSTPTGLIWVGTSKTLLVCNNSGHPVAWPILSLGQNEFIDWKSTDRDGDVWVGTTAGVVLVYRDTTLLYKRRFPKRMSGVLVNSEGFAWLYAVDGVLKVKKADFARGSFVSYGTEQGFPEPSTWPALEDREGNFWFQTIANGLFKLSDRGLVRFSNESYRGSAVIDSAGHVWGLGENGLWELWRQGEEQWHSVHHSLPAMDSVQHGGILVFDALWRLCLVSPDGFLYMYRIVHKSGVPSQLRQLGKLGAKEGILAGILLRALVDRNNRMWCSMEGSGVLIVDLNSPPRRVALLTSPHDLPIHSVRAIFQDRNGDMWLGDYNGGLVLLHESDWTKKPPRHFTTADGLPDNGIRSFGEDERGRLWVGTRFGGVAIFNGRTFQNLSIKDGLISNSIWGIARDSTGRMWLATGSGLMSVNASNPREFWWSSDVIGSAVDLCGATRDGLIWFGRGSAHLSAYDTRKRTQNLVPPPVFITNVAVNDSAMSSGGQLEMPFDRNNWLIQYIGISFKDERNVQYQYRLNSINWSKPTKQRSVSFAALSPAEYTFEVRAINSDGIASARPATLAFTIIPPFWQRWWFFALVVCLLAALIYSAYLYRVRQLLRVERLRTRIATDLHDDIGASLTRIALFSDIAKDEARISAPRLSDLADRIGNDARELLEAVSTLVWSIDPRHDRLEEVLTYMKEFAQEMFDMKGIAYRFAADPDLANLRLPVEMRRNLLLIFKESINNVVRHSACTEARVEMRLEDHELYFSIEDNGIGFSEEKRTSGHGLSNMLARAEAAQGSLSITSGAGEGTRVNLHVPVK